MNLPTKLPTNWNEVYVDQYLTLKKMDDDESSFFFRNITILSILTDTLPEDDMWQNMDVYELNTIIKQLKWLRSEPTINFKKQIGEYTCIDINTLSFGEFIDLNYYISNDFFDNFFLFCAVFYRKTKQDEWGNTMFEPYGSYDLNQRAKEFEELYITDVFGLIKYFSDYREFIYKSYENIFQPIIEDEEEVEFDEEEQKEIEQEKLKEKWSWENLLHKLSNGDITKYDMITSKPFIFILNHLSFLKDNNLT
jgi:hypothetical protein